MDAAIITAVAAVSGSIVGGLASFATTYFSQRNQAHRDFLSRDVAHREELYAQFIKEATNLYVDSLDKPLTNPTALIGMYCWSDASGWSAAIRCWRLRKRSGQHYRFL